MPRGAERVTEQAQRRRRRLCSITGGASAATTPGLVEAMSVSTQTGSPQGRVGQNVIMDEKMLVIIGEKIGLNKCEIAAATVKFRRKIRSSFRSNLEALQH